MGQHSLLPGCSGWEDSSVALGGRSGVPQPSSAEALAGTDAWGVRQVAASGSGQVQSAACYDGAAGWGGRGQGQGWEWGCGQGVRVGSRVRVAAAGFWQCWNLRHSGSCTSGVPAGSHSQICSHAGQQRGRASTPPRQWELTCQAGRSSLPRRCSRAARHVGGCRCWRRCLQCTSTMRRGMPLSLG